MNSDRHASSTPLFIPPGVALIPDDFPDRLTALRDLFGLTWEGMAAGMGVDPRQVLRWRRGGAPNGGAMLSLVRLAIRAPEGLGQLLNEDLIVIHRPRRRGYD